MIRDVFAWELQDKSKLFILAALFLVSLFSFVSSSHESHTGLGVFLPEGVERPPGVVNLEQALNSADAILLSFIPLSAARLYVLLAPIVALLSTSSLSLERERGLFASYLAASLSLRALILGKILSIAFISLAPTLLASVASLPLIDPGVFGAHALRLAF